MLKSAFKTGAKLLRASRLFVFLPLLTSAVVVRAEDEITMGRNAGGKIQVRVEFVLPLPLPVSIFPGITGFAIGEVGVHSAIFDEPEEDFFQPSLDSDFQLILLDKSPGTECWNDTGTGFLATNETFHIGPPPFDTHPLWNIPSGAPDGPHTLTLRVRDLTGHHADSDPFEVGFTPDTEPGPFQLHVTRTNAALFALTWPTNAAGWELQSAISVSGGAWERITNAPARHGTNFILDFTNAGAQRFFRLRQPR